MKKLDQTHQIFSPDKAQEIAAMLNADADDDWQYVVVDNPNPDGPESSVIEIFDEHGEFVARL